MVSNMKSYYDLMVSNCIPFGPGSIPSAHIHFQIHFFIFRQNFRLYFHIFHATYDYMTPLCGPARHRVDPQDTVWRATKVIAKFERLFYLRSICIADWCLWRCDHGLMISSLDCRLACRWARVRFSVPTFIFSTSSDSDETNAIG